MVRCIGACLGLTRSQRPQLVLALVAPRVLAPRDLSQICKYGPLTKMQCMGVQRAIHYMLMHNLTILALTSHLLIYP
jgi:hypothetical protein